MCYYLQCVYLHVYKHVMLEKDQVPLPCIDVFCLGKCSKVINNVTNVTCTISSLRFFTLGDGLMSL